MSQSQTKSTSIPCPACKHEQLKVVDHFRFRDFDGSLFNMEADFGLCGHCGFVRVMVPFSDDQISDHYANHSLYASLGGVGVGGSSQEDVARYEQYLHVLKTIIQRSGSVADIGCSSGGLLRYLRDVAGYEGQLTGVDVDMRALSALKDIEAVNGNVLNLNLPKGSIDLAFYTHVFEHILDIDRAICEMKNILPDGGYAFIEVPDATGYSACRVHDFYWIGMKEHVNHFTPKALCSLLHRHGVKVERFIRESFPMRGGVSYPSLMVLARIDHTVKGSVHPTATGDPLWLSQHIDRERRFAAKTRHNLHAFLHEKKCASVWGIGLEFFNLLATDALRLDDSIILLDSNKAKQAQTVSGYPIHDPSAMTIRNTLVCTAPLSWQPIVKHAASMGVDEHHIFCI